MQSAMSRRQVSTDPCIRLLRTLPGSHVVFRLGAGRHGPRNSNIRNNIPPARARGCPRLKLSNEPAIVATALIEASLRPALYGTSAPLATPKQSAFLASLGHKADSSNMPRPVASAWIDHYLSVRTLKSLRELQPKAGDLLRHSKKFVDPQYRRGGNGGNGSCRFQHRIEWSDVFQGWQYL